ncbi:unnamed protein product, partial [Amoebophrya sp. A120]|eukprot:GSA120T00014025001.1
MNLPDSSSCSNLVGPANDVAAGALSGRAVCTASPHGCMAPASLQRQVMFDHSSDNFRDAGGAGAPSTADFGTTFNRSNCPVAELDLAAREAYDAANRLLEMDSSSGGEKGQYDTHGDPWSKRSEHD